MNREKRTGITAMAMLLIAIPSSMAQTGNGLLGELQPCQFKKANAFSSGQVNSIQPVGEVLSAGDKELIQEIALGGMMQMELSKVAASMGTSDDVRMIAVGEIGEQTAVGAKLREIAAAGGASVPTAPDDETVKLVEKLRTQSGPEFDQMYLMKGGVEGHEKWLITMEKVRKEAENPALEALAVAALPLIHTHLRVARIESSEED